MKLNKLNISPMDEFLISFHTNTPSILKSESNAGLYLKHKITLAFMMALTLALGGGGIQYLSVLSKNTLSIYNLPGNSLVWIFSFIACTYTLLYIASEKLERIEKKDWLRRKLNEHNLRKILHSKKIPEKNIQGFLDKNSGAMQYKTEMNIGLIFFATFILPLFEPAGFYIISLPVALVVIGYVNNNFWCSASGLAMQPIIFYSFLWWKPEAQSYEVNELYGIFPVIIITLCYIGSLAKAYLLKDIQDSTNAYITSLVAALALTLNLALQGGLISLIPGSILSDRIVYTYSMIPVYSFWLILLSAAVISFRILGKNNRYDRYNATVLVFTISSTMLLILISLMAVFENLFLASLMSAIAIYSGSAIALSLLCGKILLPGIINPKDTAKDTAEDIAHETFDRITKKTTNSRNNDFDPFN